MARPSFRTLSLFKATNLNIFSFAMKTGPPNMQLRWPTFACDILFSFVAMHPLVVGSLRDYIVSQSVRKASKET